MYDDLITNVKLDLNEKREIYKEAEKQFNDAVSNFTSHRQCCYDNIMNRKQLDSYQSDGFHDHPPSKNEPHRNSIQKNHHNDTTTQRNPSEFVFVVSSSRCG
jgi:hypothetical protein